MFRNCFIFFIALSTLVQFNLIFVSSSEKSPEEEISADDYEDLLYPGRPADPYTVVHCEVACLNVKELSYNTCVLPMLRSTGIINWNWMRVFEKKYRFNCGRMRLDSSGGIQGLLRCKKQPYPDATIIVMDFPENGTEVGSRQCSGCLRIYHQINDAKLTANPKSCEDFLKEPLNAKKN